MFLADWAAFKYNSDNYPDELRIFLATKLLLNTILKNA